MTLVGHCGKITTVQMDEWKVVSGDEGGFVRVWDQRMRNKLWEWHNRYSIAARLTYKWSIFPQSNLN